MTIVGVTGHRLFRVTSAITQSVDLVLGEILKAFSEPYFFYSSLAAGADLLVARRALVILQARLVALLPMPLLDYQHDFTVNSWKELNSLLQYAYETIELPTQMTRKAAYLAAGRFMLDHIDVLVAIWDGQEVRGLGGTGQVVTEARQRCIPLAWVLAGNQGSKFDLQGAITLERFPE
jgi:hypothetical protein